MANVVANFQAEDTVFDIASAILRKHLVKGAEFSYEELSQQILSAGGIMRVAPRFSILDILHRLEKRGQISFDPGKKAFKVERDII